MKLIFTSYVSTPEYNDPLKWLARIEGYTGILEALSDNHSVKSIERINYEGEVEHNGVEYFFVKQKQKTVLFPFQMHRVIKRMKPDVVLVNGFIFPLQLIQLKRKLGRDAKIIVINRSEKPFNGAKKYLQKLADRGIDAYLFASGEFGKQWIANGNIRDPTKIFEVLHGSSIFKPGDKAEARSALQIDGSPVFLWVGRLDPNKDPITVVNAFLKFIKYQPFAKLYVIYHTEELLETVKGLISSDEKAKRAITLVGKVPHQDLQSWYDSSDFIVSASHYEGGGIAVCEAMSCGCIPILTNIVSFRKMTGPGRCGLLFEPDDEEDLLNALLKTTEMNREEERKKVLNQFNEELSFPAIAKKIEKVMDTLI